MEQALPLEPNANQFIDTLIKADKLRLLVQQSNPGLFVSLGVGILLCWILWDYADTTSLLIWLGVLFLSTLVRLYLYLFHFRNAQDAHEVLRRARPYVAKLIISTLFRG